MELLSVNNLSAIVQDDGSKKIIITVSFQVHAGETHVIMGPNGSGKSSLLATLMGHPSYQVVDGSVNFLGQDLFSLRVDQRARAGLFLSVQQPYAIPGVILSHFLKESFQALYPTKTVDVYLDRLFEACSVLGIDQALLDRPLYEGFSGGEKKRCEMLQVLVLQPQLVLLDEIDSGLDADAFKKVQEGLRLFKQWSPQSAVVCVTHYGHMIEGLRPDMVHVMHKGKFVVSGDMQIAVAITTRGYQPLLHEYGLV